MNLIDAVGLTDAPIPVETYAKALRLSGSVLGPEVRDLALRTMQEHPPEVGQYVVYTGPSASRYWLGAPVTVKVFVVPGDGELSALDRVSGLEWGCTVAGLAPGQAQAFASKEPTVKHSAYAAFLDALAWQQAWQLLTPRDDLEWLDDLPYIGEFKPPRQDRPYEVVIVDDMAKYSRLAEELQEASRERDRVGIDFETDADESFEASIVGVAFAFRAERKYRTSPRGSVAYYLPFNGTGTGAVDAAAALSLLQLYFGSTANQPEPCDFDAHNGKFELQVFAKTLDGDNPLPHLRRLSPYLRGDGMIAAYCSAKVDYQSGRPLPKGLKDETLRHFGVVTLHYQEMLDLSGAQKASEAPLSDIGPYCCADAYWGVQVREYEEQELLKYPKLNDIYWKVELPTVKVTAEMELLGLRLDYALLEKRKKEIAGRVEVYRRYLEERAVEMGYELKRETKACPLHSRKKVDYADCPSCDDRGRVELVVPYNPNSGPQVEAFLQGTLLLPRMASTEGGSASNDEPAILRLREFTDNEDVKEWLTFLLAWRHENKLSGTYMEGMWIRKRHHRDYNGPEEAPQGWFIHPTFNQAVTTSSRYSSKDPNGQNIPFKQRDLFV